MSQKALPSPTGVMRRTVLSEAIAHAIGWWPLAESFRFHLMPQRMIDAMSWWK